jgi:type III secretion protein Y
MNEPDAASAELLHSLGYLYMRTGQPSRALVFLLIANRLEPDHPGILRTLAAVFIENDAPERALGAVDRLAAIETGPSATTLLLRARALWVLGEQGEARHCFRDYITLRRTQ